MVTVEWDKLDHCYGPAGDLPAILARLSPDPKADVWHELRSRVCHQGTVYSASFACLPHLLSAASSWKPSQRTMPIALAAGIVCSTDVRGARDALIARHHST